MTPTPRVVSLLAAFALLLLAPLARAQDAFAKKEQDLVRACVSTLSTFATVGKSQKVGHRAKQAYDLMLQYDPNQPQARSELGFRKEKDKWVEETDPKKKKKWVDKATYEARFKVMDEWYKTSMKLGALHRALGLELKAAGNLGRASYHLEKAVYYNALDKEANEALGYKQGPGFYGTDAQIAFALKMKEIETTAIEIAKKEYPVEALPLEKMPKELVALADAVPEWMKKPSFDIHGAKSERFTVWTRGSQENANNAVKWGERALDFGVYLLGPERAKRLAFVENATRVIAWRGFLWTRAEREKFLEANPHVWQGGKDVKKPEDAMRFVNNVWRAAEGTAVIETKLAPVQVHDAMIGVVFKYGLGASGNDGMSEGILHAACWYLQSTSITRFGALPEGTQGDREFALPEQTNWWLRAIRDQATSNTDWPAEQVPREQLSRFRNDCRLKSWSFTTFLMAAYPGKWVDYYLKLPSDKIPTLEDVNRVAEETLGRKLADVEAEWREWARGDSGVAAGTGYGPPLLPERPNKEELAVLDRLNAVRGLMIAYTWPTGESMKVVDMCKAGAFKGLPPCDLDAETSAACEAHSRYLTKWTEEHMKWPEAHEENPAREGFTPRGQRAGMSSVIVFLNAQGGVDFARDSVDGWIGTPYHRFPLLEHNINRFGYAFLFENGWTVATLDMGSLEEPYDPREAPKLTIFPANDMASVPRSFHGREFPNPLEDQPADVQDITKTGFPISMQFQREVASQLTECGIKVFECKSHGRLPPQNMFVAEDSSAEKNAWLERCGGSNAKEVPIWVHTPMVPLNKRVEIRDTLFAIPKEHLEATKRYQVRVEFGYGGNPKLVFFWEFTTGSQQEGLKLK